MRGFTNSPWTPDEWKARSYAIREKYEGLVFDRSLRGTNAASRVLGVGHILFDTALEVARSLPARVALAEGMAAPLLIIAVEDEVTGTGALVHRLIFGVTDAEAKMTVLRDWELLRALNNIAARTLAEGVPMAVDYKPELKRLKQAFDADLPRHAPMMHRPASWPEMLLVPCPQLPD